MTVSTLNNEKLKVNNDYNEQIDSIPVTNNGDSFQNDMYTVKSFLNKMGKGKLNSSRSFASSVEFGSPCDSPYKTPNGYYDKLNGSRMYRESSEMSEGMDSSKNNLTSVRNQSSNCRLNGKFKNQHEKFTKSTGPSVLGRKSYLGNLMKKFNPVGQKPVVKSINLYKTSGCISKLKNGWCTPKMNRRSSLMSSIKKNKTIYNLKPTKYGEKAPESLSKIQSIANKLKQKLNTSRQFQHKKRLSMVL
jgi:hypothetical protein